MCTREQLSNITEEIARTAKIVFGQQFDSALLYGSYARGDFDEESDIDIMVLVHLPQQEISKFKRIFTRLTAELGLINDIVITVTLKDAETFNRFVDVVPFYGNVKREGIQIAV